MVSFCSQNIINGWNFISFFFLIFKTSFLLPIIVDFEYSRLFSCRVVFRYYLLNKWEIIKFCKQNGNETDQWRSLVRRNWERKCWFKFTSLNIYFFYWFLKIICENNNNAKLQDLRMIFKFRDKPLKWGN